MCINMPLNASHRFGTWAQPGIGIFLVWKRGPARKGPAQAKPAAKGKRGGQTTQAPGGLVLRPPGPTAHTKTARTKTQATRAAPQTQASPARPRLTRLARFHKSGAVPIAACGIEAGYHPTETDFDSAGTNHRDGSVKSRGAGIRECQVELCHRQHGKGDSLRHISHNCD